MKNFIQHVVYSHREGLRWYFKSTERKDTFVISLYPWDIRLLKYGFYLLIPPRSRVGDLHETVNFASQTNEVRILTGAQNNKNCK